MAERSGIRTALLVLTLLAVLVALPVGASADARSLRATGQAASDEALRLRSQTTWWSPDQPFTIEVAVDTPDADNLELAVDIFARLPHRSAFAQTVQRGVSGRPTIEVPPVPVSAAPLDADGDRVLTFTPTLRAEGVYPVRVELRAVGGRTPVDSFVTHLVHVPASIESEPLHVALMVPVHAPPAVQPDGRVAIDDERAELLAALAGSLEDHTNIDLTFVPTPETVEALASSPREQDRQTLATLVASLATRQLVGGPWVPTNLTAMLNAGLDEESAGLVTRGAAALRMQFSGVDPTTATRLIDERLTDEGLAHLQTQQAVERLVLPEALLEPISRNTTLTETFVVKSRRGTLQAASADAALAAHFNNDDAVLGAQHLLADLAVIYNDDPGVARRGVIVLPPGRWEPARAFTDALLTGLGVSPILEGVGIDRLFTEVEAETTGSRSRPTPVVREIDEDARPAAATPNLPGGTITETRRRIDRFASAVDTTDELGAAVIDRLDRTLLASTSIDLRARDRVQYIDGVNEQIREQIDAIEMPQNRSITLTAREGEIPVTVSSALGYPVRGVLIVVSDTLEFPAGDRHDLALAAQRNTTSQFAVRAQTSGSFPIRVRLESPAGLVLADSRFTVRSTAISGVGTALSIGAALFLLVWWANHLRGRRSRRLVPS